MTRDEQIKEFMNRGREAQKAINKILKKQPCKTCGGSEIIHKPLPYNRKTFGKDIEPCPDCQEKKASQENIS